MGTQGKRHGGSTSVVCSRIKRWRVRRGGGGEGGQRARRPIPPHKKENCAWPFLLSLAMARRPLQRQFAHPENPNEMEAGQDPVCACTHKRSGAQASLNSETTDSFALSLHFYTHTHRAKLSPSLGPGSPPALSCSHERWSRADLRPTKKHKIRVTLSQPPRYGPAPPPPRPLAEGEQSVVF